MLRAAIVLVMLAASTARADADAPDDLIARPLVLAPGRLEAHLVIEAGLAPRAELRPLTLAPDVWFGITRRLTIGAIHSDASLDRIAAGASFCVREIGTLPSPCTRTYRGSGLDARWSAIAGAHFALAPRARLLLRDVDPVKPAMTLGALVRWTSGRFSIASDPYVRVGLANQDRGNRTAISVPLYLALQPMRGWQVWLHAGYEGDTAVWRDGYHLPLGIGTQHRLGAQLDAGVEAGWSSPLGPQHDYHTKIVLVTVGFRS